uniref:Egg case protein-like protein 6 n=1 Tax=Liphistius malayanus TaxID=1203467 RepID=I6TH86_9ARAC|nr:egg case protein-like protein 6 [Liphistius malayanus]
MNVYVAGSFLLISVILTLGDANKVKPPKDVCGEECKKLAKKKCYGKKEFDANCCTSLSYQQNYECQYQCICNGSYYYYNEEFLTECGEGKVCLDYSCVNIVEDADCGSDNCDGVIAVEDPSNPCQYRCYKKNQCGYTLNNFPCGEPCPMTYLCETGRCNLGICEFSQDGNYCECPDECK